MQMDFREIAKKRCSVRSYEDRPVEMEKLIQILESGRFAPTGANRQPQRLIVVKETDDLARLAGGANTFKAPLAIIVCADHGASWKRSYDRKDIADIDASIVTDHMMLQATDLGLGSCWICHFNPEVIRKEFNIPAQVEPINILAIGYSADAPKPDDRHDQDRMPLKSIVHYGRYGTKE